MAVLGMSEDGVLTTIDIEPEHQHIAKQAFADAGIGPSRTRLISGRAQDVLTRLADDSYDLVFIDADPLDQPITWSKACGCCARAGSSSCTARRWAGARATPAHGRRGGGGARGGTTHRRE